MTIYLYISIHMYISLSLAITLSLSIILSVFGRSNKEHFLVLEEDRGDRLIAGCGDNNVYVFDLETRELVHTLAGHRKYVHSVAAADGSGGVSVVSGGEDGAVKLWDTR